MAQHEDGPAGSTVVYLSPMAQRRTEFSGACAGLFARIDLAHSVEACAALLEEAQPDLLVIDLERLVPDLDRPALDDLLVRRLQASSADQPPPTLLLCPFATARWLPPLLGWRGASYAITPLEPGALRARVGRCLTQPEPAGPAALQGQVQHLGRLLGMRARAQEALDGAADVQDFAARLCEVLSDPLAGWPGLLHAAVFHLKIGDDLQLEAQHGKPELRLATLLGRADRLLQAPLRHAFPALLAAASGEPVLLEAPDQGGEPDLARMLRHHGVAQAVGVPIPADGPGAARGALSLLFDTSAPFTPGELALLDDLARLAALGMRLLETGLENDTLLARLTHATTLDALTGVANRRHGEDLLEKEIKRARRYRLPLALVAIDIDRFKAINETYGYPVGDVALRTVAEATAALLRTSDVLVRSGGEEFQVIAPHTSAIDALKMAEKIRLAIEQTPIPGCDQLTVSLGVAQLGEHESADSLTQRADAALARAKRAGRNCVELAMQ